MVLFRYEEPPLLWANPIPEGNYGDCDSAWKWDQKQQKTGWDSLSGPLPAARER